MTPFWHPLSTLYLAQPRCYASGAMIRMMLAGEGAVNLIYGGDRMWPAVMHGQAVLAEPCAATAVRVGDALVVEHQRIPDLLRVVRQTGPERFLLRGDADALHGVEVDGGALLGRAALKPCLPTQATRHLRRLRLDLLEALRHGPENPAAEDPAQTVRSKYDAQAPFYDDYEGEMITAPMLTRMRQILPPDAAVLVVGSGSGSESFALHRSGYRVRGVDFSAAMTSAARRRARERNLDVEFIEADIREHSEERSSLNGIFFTYESYSFLPHAAARSALLRGMAAWLAPGGAIFLSARIVRGIYDRLILGVQRLRPGQLRPAAYGDNHTRYLTPDGVLHRSFVHCFTPRALRREAADAGLVTRLLPEGHFELRRNSDDEAA